MKNSTLFILFIISFSFFSCFDKKQEKYDIEMLNAVLKDKIKQNDRIIRRFWAIAGGKSRGRISNKEKNAYQKAISIQTMRNIAFENSLKGQLNKTLSKEYEDFLRENTTTNLTEEGQANLKRLYAQLKLYEQNGNKNKIEKISWALTCLELETYYLYSSEFYITNNEVAGGAVFGTYFNFIFYNTISNIKEEKKIIFLPSLPKKKKYTHCDSLTFQINGFKEQIPYKWESLGGLSNLRFIPPKVGDYKIEGSYIISFEHSLENYKRRCYFQLDFKVK